MSDIARQLLEAAAEGGALKALAVSLSHDRHGADDLLQEAYLAFLRSPKKIDPPAIPWLANAMRFLARYRRRSDRNRARREIVAARTEASEASDASLTRFECRRMIVDHVAALDRADREIIVLRFFDGLSPQAIARRLSITDGAARTRLSRALDALRKRLDHTHGGDRTLWRSALVPLCAGGPVASGGTAGVIAMKVKTKVLTALALVLVVSIGGYLVWDPFAVDDDLSSQRAISAQSAETTVRRQAPTTKAPLVEPAIAETRPIQPAENVEPESRPARTGQGVVVTVVDHGTGDKVDGADVFLIPRVPDRSARPADTTSASSTDSSYRRKYAETSGRLFRTDKNGRAKLEGWQLGDRIDVFHGNRTGSSGKVILGGSEITVVIAEPRTLSVVVLHGDGSPAHEVSLNLVSRSFGAESDTVASYDMTDAFGRAKIPLLPVSGGGAVVGRLFFGIPGVAGPVREFDTDSLPTDDVSLPMPALCDLRLEIVGPDGRPIPEGSVVLGAERTVPISSGVALVRAVGTDAEIIGEIHSPGRPPRPFKVTERREAGSTISQRIELEGRPVALKARIVDSDGRPIAAAMIRVEAKDANDRATSAALLYSAPDGQIAWIHLDYGSKVDLHVRNYSLRVPSGTTVPLDIRPETQSLDLGDIAIDMPKPALGGVVASASGAPIGGATVRLETVDPAVGGSTSFLRSDENGRFSTPSNSPIGTEVRLAASADGYLDGQPVQAKIGDLGIDLRLETAQRITGSILVGPAVDPTAFRVEARQAGASSGYKNDPDDDRGMTAVETTRAGRFSIGNLLPGTYDILVRSGGRDVVARVNAVRVGPGIDPDPRLHPIDLSSRFSAMKIIVRSTDGALVSDAVFRPIGRGRSDQEWRSSDVGSIPLDKENLPEAVIVDADGFFAEAIPAAPGRREVVLRKTVDVKLVLGTDGPTSSAEYLFGVAIDVVESRRDDVSEPVSEQLRSLRGLSSSIEMANMAFKVPANSEHTIRFWIEKFDGGKSAREFIDALPAKFTTGSALLHLDVRLDPRSLAEAKTRIGVR